MVKPAGGRLSLLVAWRFISGFCEKPDILCLNYGIPDREMKRATDIVLSVLLLLFLLPLLVLLALLVRLAIGKPVLYRQLRPGLHEEPFELVKFRTMRVMRDDAGNPLSDEHRMTALGTILRRTSLDELPELWNVLKGDMSLVGPRPLLIEYLPLYTHEQGRRHDVLPGLTGWAQVNGRNAISWEEKFRLDAWYVDNQSFWLDLRILFMTLVSIFRSGDVSQEGHVTMEKFRGSR